MDEFRILKLNSIVIHVRDLEKSIHFYKNVLRLQEDFTEEGMAWFSIGAEYNKVPVMLHASDESFPVDKGISFDLVVDDVEEAVSSISQAGGVIVQKPIVQEWGVKEAIIADVDGYKIYLIQHLS